VHFSRQTVGSSDALGDGQAAGTATGIYYSQYAAEIEMERDTPFLIKNLLPLILLICVAYLSLFFKAADGSAPVSLRRPETGRRGTGPAPSGPDRLSGLPPRHRDRFHARFWVRTVLVYFPLFLAARPALCLRRCRPPAG
jgi:hypothetical protein